MSDIQVNRTRLVYQCKGEIDRDAYCGKFKTYLEKIGVKLKEKLGAWAIDNVNVDMVSFFADENNKQTLIWINVAVVLINKKDNDDKVDQAVHQVINDYLLSFNMPKKSSSQNRIFHIE